MNLESAIVKLNRFITSRLQVLSMSITSGGVDNMEKYKYLLGQAQAYQIIIQEISNLLKKEDKELNDGNVINIDKGGNSKTPERPSTKI